MKNIILKLTMTTLLIASLGLAQGGKRGGKMAESLNLSADQKPQVIAILKEQREATQAARKNNASKEDLKAIHEKTHNKLASVLDADQLKKFDTVAEKARQRRKPKA